MQRKEFGKQEYRDASKLKVGIIVARFNSDITEAMLRGAMTLLKEWKVADKNIYTLSVPGSFELPVGALSLIKKKKPHAVIAIGCVIKGETEHDRYIALAASQGLMRVGVETGVPVSFGVLTVNSLEQAKARSSGSANHGYSAAAAALSTALETRSL